MVSTHSRLCELVTIIDSETSIDNVLQSILAVEELSQSLGNVETQENALERDANAAGAQCMLISP
jgi:hypothetical protein